MKYLTIIRHAKSSWENPNLGDIVRPLNDRGKKSVIIIGNYLLQLKIKPDLFISSPAKRAIDTAKRMRKLLNNPLNEIVVCPEVYFGTSKAILELLKKTDTKFSVVFLFGHEPILSSLIFQLTKTELEKFPTCSVFRIAFKISDWAAITQNNGVCEFYVNPKQLLKK